MISEILHYDSDTIFLRFLLHGIVLFFFTPADAQPSTSELLPNETSVLLPPTLSEPFQPMNFKFPKTKSVNKIVLLMPSGSGSILGSIML